MPKVLLVAETELLDSLRLIEAQIGGLVKVRATFRRWTEETPDA